MCFNNNTFIMGITVDGEALLFDCFSHNFSNFSV